MEYERQEEYADMILAIDVGNTNTVIGGFDGETLRFTVRISTNQTQTADEYALKLQGMFTMHKVCAKEIEGGIISSVVPVLSPVLQQAVEQLTGQRVLIVGSGLKTGLNIRIDNPGQLGSDLVVDAVAASHCYQKPILIFDMGTATTLSVMDGKGGYIGGMIMPGIRLAMDALSSSTSQLPRVDLTPPGQIIGTNTVECMQSGAIYGNAAMIDGVIDRLEEQLGEHATVVATGGMVNTVIPYCRHKIISDETLMLRGLKILYEKNRPAVERRNRLV